MQRNFEMLSQVMKLAFSIMTLKIRDSKWSTDIKIHLVSSLKLWNPMESSCAWYSRMKRVLFVKSNHSMIQQLIHRHINRHYRSWKTRFDEFDPITHASCFIMAMHILIAVNKHLQSWTPNFKIVTLAVYSLDLALRDFYLFPLLKQYLKGHHFKSNNEVERFVHAWCWEWRASLLPSWDGKMDIPFDHKDLDP